MSRFRFFGREQRSAQELPHPSSYIIQPQVDAHVRRLADGRLRLRWMAVADFVQIYVADTPHSVMSESPLLEVGDGQEVDVDLWSTAVQPTFQLKLQGGAADGQQIVVAERAVALQRGVNFRDMGGYLTQNGQHVRWGRIYRAGFLAKLTAADIEILAALNLQTVCDFRSEYETKQMPDRLPTNPSPTYVPLPASSVISRWRQFLAVVHYRNRLGHLLLRGYTDVMLAENAALLGDVLSRIADAKNLPLLVHCTAGKDRTGVLVALLLALLGVDDETIIADYSLSNAYFEHYAPILSKDIQRLTSIGFTQAQIRPILLADPAIMQSMLNYMRKQYGTVESYVRQQCGLDNDIIRQIRQNLLV